MPRPRKQLVDLNATAYYHCINRCVRQMFLLGDDPLTGANFDHRRQWIADRITELTGLFAVDVCSYSLMSNHFHLVVHIDAARARGLSDGEVIERTEMLYPGAVAEARLWPAAKWESKVVEWRGRLMNLSWFMRCLNEYIARRANRETKAKGRFWEGRFRSQALLDVGALLTCMAYVDLNPIRAGIAETLEESDLTSIRQRLLAAATPAGLAPFADEVGEITAQPKREPLPIERAGYMELLRWTAAAYRGESLGTKQAPAVLEQTEIDREGFLETLREFPRRFFTMVGQVQCIDLESKRRGYRRRPGLSGARRLYRDVAA